MTGTLIHIFHPEDWRRAHEGHDGIVALCGLRVTPTRGGDGKPLGRPPSIPRCEHCEFELQVVRLRREEWKAGQRRREQTA